MRTVGTRGGDEERLAGDRLQAVAEHRAVGSFEDVAPDLDAEIGADAEDVAVEGGVVQAAEAISPQSWPAASRRVPYSEDSHDVALRVVREVHMVPGAGQSQSPHLCAGHRPVPLTERRRRSEGFECARQFLREEPGRFLPVRDPPLFDGAYLRVRSLRDE